MGPRPVTGAKGVKVMAHIRIKLSKVRPMFILSENQKTEIW